MNRVSSLIVLAILWISTTAGATTPTQVQNVADPTNHPYEQFATTACTLQGDCSILFPAITTGRTLILRTSCAFSLAVGGSLVEAQLGEQNSNPRNMLQVFTFGGSTNFAINSDTYLFYVKGQQPRIDLISTGAPVQELSCTLSGYHF
jgi:hypothetical protein